MNRTFHNAARRAALLAFAGGALAGCKDFLTAKNISTVDASSIDALRDAATLSNSSLQDFAQAYSLAVMYTAWFTGEAIATETFQGPNDFVRRDVSNALGDVDLLYGSMSRALISSGRVIDVLRGTPGEASNVDLARAELVRGYAFELLAEQFCQATVNGGPALDTNALLDSAQAHLVRAVTVGQAVGTATATAMANAALVGRARSELQRGNKVAAAATAGQVPAGFTYNIAYFDDPSNRDRLGNQLWQRTFSRGSISVAPAFRGLNDPRVVLIAPGQGGFTSQDGVTPLYAQTKYTGYASPVRLASRLEADYIAAEATGTDAQLALVNARRAANRQPAYTGPTDAASVLAEFMTQKSLDFFLEGKRLGDLRRNGAAVKNVPVPGTPYSSAPYGKVGYGPIGSQTCYPVPLNETANNPNFGG